ncbi:hypothetical protein ACFSKU_04385 [Pontibacter silvestris]|uniref:Uncharacterized protein n=1 Tax=Pontibacter silvestris TaxID=2305183 RepID=A0ABW4WTN6_9BACT|nr:hypothetical protein [Pontibacter silvestris]
MSFLYNVLPQCLDKQLYTTNLLLRPYQEGDEHDFMRLVQENTPALDPAFRGRGTRWMMPECK